MKLKEEQRNRERARIARVRVEDIIEVDREEATIAMDRVEEIVVVDSDHDIVPMNREEAMVADTDEPPLIRYPIQEEEIRRRQSAGEFVSGVDLLILAAQALA